MAEREVDDSALAGLYNADGHVRVYHGGLTALPRRYLARMRLCLRGTTDYWVNGLGGEPFFVITQTVNPGLVAMIREKIVPRLLAEAPQPSEAALQADPKAMRFTLLMDREGYGAIFPEESSSGHRKKRSTTDGKPCTRATTNERQWGSPQKKAMGSVPNGSHLRHNETGQTFRGGSGEGFRDTCSGGR